jgi:hypothetical protein
MWTPYYYWAMGGLTPHTPVDRLWLSLFLPSRMGATVIDLT